MMYIDHIHNLSYLGLQVLALDERLILTVAGWQHGCSHREGHVGFPSGRRKNLGFSAEKRGFKLEVS